MANITFAIDTNIKFRIEIKKQIAVYCIERDYEYKIDEQREPLISHFSISIQLPDNKLNDELKIFKAWGDTLNHDINPTN